VVGSLERSVGFEPELLDESLMKRKREKKAGRLAKRWKDGEASKLTNLELEHDGGEGVEEATSLEMLGGSDDRDSIVFDDVAFGSEVKEEESQRRVMNGEDEKAGLPIPNPSGATGPKPKSRRAGFPQLPERGR